MVWSFAQNKIYGSLGESVCEATFNRLGFDVERTGIEHKTPMLAAHINQTHHRVSTSYGGDVTEFIRRTPDFLMSRINKKGFTEALYVEAKFRYCKDRDDLLAIQESLRKNLEKHIKLHPSTLIFLVTNPMPESNTSKAALSMIWLLSSKNTNRWVPARKTTDFRIYDGLSDNNTLALVVKNEIAPVLNLIFTGQQQLSQP